MPKLSAEYDVSEIMRSDVMECERPDPIFGGRARARHKSQESIRER